MRLQRPQEQRYPFLTMRTVFSCVQRYGCQCLGSLTCAQMLMHAIAHEGCADTVRESALKVDSGRKIPLPRLGIEPASAACRFHTLPTELHPSPKSNQPRRSHLGETEFIRSRVKVWFTVCITRHILTLKSVGELKLNEPWRQKLVKRAPSCKV